MKNVEHYRIAALSLAVSALVSVTASSHAEEMTMEARRQSVTNLEQHLDQRGLRLGSIAEDINSLDGRVETGIEKIVTMVSTIGDSEDSKLRIAQLKGDIVTRLRKSIEFYDRQRNTLKEELRKENTPIPRETLTSDLNIFNERIEKRVEQIKTIAASFPAPEDLEKYVVTDTHSWGWRTYQNEEISEAWKQERRDSKQTDSMQKQLLTGLEESIEHLNKRNGFLSGKLKGTNISATERELYQSDLEGNEALIELRQNQIKSFMEKEAPEVTTLSRGDAHDTELLIQDMVSDLREDFFSIFRKYTELNKERADLDHLQKNLAARKQWLLENDK